MFFLKLFSYLPFSVLYLISDFLFFVSYHLVRYRRKMVMKNLTNSFPDKSETELKKIEHDFYVNLCDYAVETLKLLTISKEELKERMIFCDVTPIERFKENNQSVLLLAAHQFNWEWLVAAGNFNLPMQVDYVYQAQNSEFFNRYSQYCRMRFGAYSIKRDEVAREAAKRKHITRAIAIVADQYPGYKRDKKYQLKFLNQDTVFFYGANQLAVMLQYPVCFAHIKKIKRGYYSLEFKVISNPPYVKESNIVVEQYAKAVEDLIHEQPSGWLWSHNRWKIRHIKRNETLVNPA